MDQVSYAKQGVIVNNFSVLADVWRAKTSNLFVEIKLPDTQ